MANLHFIQKQLMEDVFGMKDGYFLDFTKKREFEEFMNDIVSYSILNRYPGLSMAKSFRAFCRDEEDRFVGKAIISAINYMRDRGLCDISNQNVNKLYELGKGLLGKTTQTNQTVRMNSPSVQDYKLSIDFNQISKKLLEIEQEKTQQLKGYAFERFISWLLEEYKMEPRTAYKTDTDQIDGSFLLGESTILIEAKYKTTIIDKDELVLFQNKLEHKSNQARGVFISYSEVSDKAISYFSNHGSRITIIYTREIFQMCQYKADFRKIKKKKFRHLDETGCIWFPIPDYDKLK